MTAAKQTERLAQDVKMVVHDAENLLKLTGEEISDKAREQRKKLSRVMKSARESCRQVEDQVGTCLKATDRLVREHPYEALAISIGAGLLTGFLLTRK